MYLKVGDTFRTTKRLKLGDDAWFITNTKTPVQNDEIKMGAMLELEGLHWTDGPVFDPDCVLCFDEIGSKIGGPEFNSSELHQFLKDGVLVVDNE